MSAVGHTTVDHLALEHHHLAAHLQEAVDLVEEVAAHQHQAEEGLVAAAR